MLTAIFNRIAFCIVVSVFLVNTIVAQTTQGGITGAVRDDKGANIANAKVTVKNAATGLERETTAADNGIFRIMALPTGVYQIRAESPGFATGTTTGVDVGIDQIRTIDVTLHVG